jgi:integrase
MNLSPLWNTDKQKLGAGRGNRTLVCKNDRGKPLFTRGKSSLGLLETGPDVCTFVCNPMASVFQKPKSPFWYAAYRNAKGERVQKSTKRTNRTEAEDMARQFEKLGLKARAKTLTEAQARRVVSEILEDATGEPLHFHSTRDWFAEWLAGKKGAVSPRSLARYSQVCREFLTHLGPKADLTIGGVTVKDVRSWRDVLAETGMSAVTINQNVRKMLSGPFVAAFKQGFIALNPCAAVEALQEEDSGARQPFTAQQVNDILDAADEHWEGVILFGYHTALRLRDITELDWSSVHGDILQVTPRKTKRLKKSLIIPLHPDLQAWLKERKVKTGPVFPTLTGRPTGGKSALSGMFAALMADAKVVGDSLREGKGRGRRTNSLSFHSLRHSCVSTMANAGVSKELRQVLSGHSDDASHKRYTHHELEQLRAAIAKVPSLRSK